MKFAKFIHIAAIAVSVLLIVGQILLSSQRTQRAAAEFVTSYSNSILGTEFSASSVRLAYPFGIELRGVTVFDQSHDTLASVSLAIAHFKPGQLLHRKLSISNIRLIHPDVRLHADSLGARPNYAFLTEIFKSGADNEKSGLLLRANSIVLRNASFTYDILDLPVNEGRFDRNHIGIDNLSTSISLKALGTDTVSVSVRRLRARERSGFAIRSIRGSIAAGPHSVSIDGLTLHTEGSSISISDFKSETGLADIRKPLSSVSFMANADATVTGRDFKAFIPGTADMDERITMVLNACCDSNLLSISNFTVRLEHNELSMNSTASIRLDPAFNLRKMTQSEATLSAAGHFSNGLPKWIDRQLGGFGFSIPDEFRNLGNGSFYISGRNGANAQNLTVSFESEVGEAALEFNGENGRYSANLDGNGIHLGKILETAKAGPCSFTLSAVADSTDNSIAGSARLDISSAILGGYNYRGITADASIHGNEYGVSVNFSDTNGSLSLLAGMRSGKVPEFWARIDADSIRLGRYSLGRLDSIEVSGQLSTVFDGTDIDFMEGQLSIDSLSCLRPDGRNWHMQNMSATLSGGNGKQRTATISSDFINATMVGDYRFSTIASSFSTIASIIVPTLADWLETNVPACRKKITIDDNLIFNVSIDNLDFTDVIFDKPVYLSSVAALSLQMNGTDAGFQCKANIPELQFNGNTVSGFDLKATLNTGIFHSDINGCITLESGQRFCLQNSADAGISQQDSVDISFGITNNLSGTSIPLLTHIRFDGMSSRRLKSSIFIDPTVISYNSDRWNLSLDSISIHKSSVRISDLMLHEENTMSSLLAYGTVSADSTDVLHLIADDVDMGRTMSMLHADKIGLKGIASGQIDLMGLIGKPAFEGSACIDGFEFMTSRQGDLEANFVWNRELSEVDITGIAIDSSCSARTVLDGFYRPGDSFIEMNIGATHTDLHFLNKWTHKVFTELSGRTTGQLRLFGNKRSLDLEGETVLENGIFNMESIGAKFIIKEDTLRFEPGKMIFDNIVCYDEYGHDGIMNCHILHDNFHNFRVDMDADVTDMMVYSIPKTEKSNIFATVYAEGSVKLLYNRINGLDIKADARTSNGTRFGFKQAYGQVGDYNFLSIVDRNSISADTATMYGTAALESGPSKRSGFNLDLNVECDYSAIFDLSMGALTGLMRGDGNIGIQYDNKDGIRLNGIYNLSYGMCSLSLEGLVRKTFSLNDGSYVRFNGPLMDTELNLQTYHTVNNASMHDLDPSVSANNSSRVRCLMDVTGTASTPSLSFDIDMLNGTAQEKDILASATATEEQRNIQFMYLLALGHFYSYDVNADAQETNSQSPVESILNSAVNGQINRLMSSFLRSDQISLSSHFNASSFLSNDATDLSDKELEGILEAHLLDNRLLVNGNFGYRESTINNTSNFIGDVEVRYKLLPRQGISLKGYNKSNDKYFSKTTLTTQGVGLVFERDF